METLTYDLRIITKKLTNLKIVIKIQERLVTLTAEKSVPYNRVITPGSMQKKSGF